MNQRKPPVYELGTLFVLMMQTSLFSIPSKWIIGGAHVNRLVAWFLLGTWDTELQDRSKVCTTVTVSWRHEQKGVSKRALNTMNSDCC